MIDAEHAFDPTWGKKLGVELDTLLVSQPNHGEEAMQITEMLVKSNAVDVIIVDSVAALIPKQELEGEIGDSHVGLQARPRGTASLPSWPLKTSCLGTPSVLWRRR